MKSSLTDRGGHYVNNIYDLYATPRDRVVTTPTVANRRQLTVYSAPSGGRRHVMTAQSYQTETRVALTGNWTMEKRTATGALVYLEQSSGPNGLPGYLPKLPNASDSYNRCLEQVLDALRGTVDLSVGLAQSGQLLGMHKAAAKLAVEMLRGLRLTTRSVFEARSRALRREILRPGVDVKRKAQRFKPGPDLVGLMKTGGSAHLSYVYGLKPLMQDLHGSITQLASACDNNRRLSGRASARVTESSRRSDDSNVTMNYWAGTASHRTEMCLDYAQTGSAIETMARFTSLNPASIAWELLPWSFVFDWFYDVGGYLRALETSLVMPGAASGYVTTTTKRMGTQTIVGLGKADPSGYKYTGSRTGTYVLSTKTRNLVTSLPIPRKPHFSAKLGSTRLLNAASLLTTFLGRK